MRGAVVSGVAAAMAAASLGEVPKADATCVGIFGISINDRSGGHCSATFFSFALGLGPGTSATADGQLNAAIAVGNNVSATAGFEQDEEDVVDAFTLAINVGNATDGAVSTVEAGNGTFNLAANLGGNANAQPGREPVDMDISAGDGIENVALNVIGNRNTIRAEQGALNFAINTGAPFSFPNGSDNLVTATGGLSVAFNSRTFLGESCPSDVCGNTVTAGPLSLVIAAGVVRKLVVGGITFANSFNSSTFPDNPNLPSTDVFAAGGTQGNRVRLNSTGNSTTNGVAAGGTQAQRVRPSLNAASNRQETTSTGGSVHRSVSDSTKKWAKKFSDRGSRSTSGLARNAKADADNTDSDK